MKARRLTKHERYIMKKYTRVRHNTLRLHVDHQEFDIFIINPDPANIKWYQKMLTIALSRMAEEVMGEV